jgi:hypothetical protein
MHSALQLVGLWALAFVTLSAAMVLLNIYTTWVGNDLTFRSVAQEAVIAGVASLIEGASIWAVLTYIPTAGRALLIPAAVVALLYKITHLEEWSKYDIILLLLIQIALGSAGTALFTGHFLTAVIILSVVGGFLAFLGNFLRNL